MTSRRRRLGIALVVLSAALPILLLAPAHLAAADGEDGSVTKSGTGRFSDIKVTVSKVQHMRNEVIRVSWSGAHQSAMSGSNFRNNYMQIMQCWGDESTPQREKCQYGGIFDDQRGGEATSNRDIINNGQIDDPNEIPAYKGTFGRNGVVPFDSVTGDVIKSKRNPFFDTLSTNEIDYGRTSADGTGEEFFEIQTGREAAGLGCGQPEDNGSTRNCWIVVVPRDDKEVNGVDASDTANGRLETSPLAASNFANAISFRLDFDPIGVTCPLGTERRVIGNEEAFEAVSLWQPVLCGAAGTIFGYSQIGDDLARNQAVGDDPWLSLVNRPVDTASNTDGRLLTYAPLTISGIGVGVVIERYPKDSAPASEKEKRGTRVLDLKLDARLVAKLLTQSYKAAVTGDASYISTNPRWLAEDPEFLALNPEFDQLQEIGQLYAITNPLDLADANRAIWEWIKSDPDAKAFIGGKPDPWGMKINPYYKGMDLDRSDFPRSDPTCVTFTNGQTPLCALDHLAYSNDYHTAARGAIKGLTLANDNWDFGPPPRYKQNAPQAPGQRAVLALMDSATAARFKISMAGLRNAAGQFVTPTEDAMDAAVAGMKDSEVPGVLETNPATKIRVAYPLTEVTYALTAPRQLSADEAKDYAAFIRYAVGKGQTPGIAPGQLPAGYLPLSDDMRKQALAAAALIAKRGGPLPASSSGDGDSSGSGNGGSGSSGGGDTATPTTQAPSGEQAPTGTPAVTSPPAGSIVPASAPTPNEKTPMTRFVLLGAALLGLLAALTRPALVVAGALRRRAAATPENSR
jgi:hypothetical protein